MEPDEVFDQIERGIPDGHRLGSDPQIVMALTLLACVDPQAFEWVDGVGMLLTADLVLVGRQDPHGEVELRRWERYGFLRYGTGTSEGRYVVRSDYEDGSNVLFLFSAEQESSRLADYFASG